MTAMSHICIRVLDLEKSIAFYKENLGLTIQREISMPDRGWELVFLGDSTTDYQLELCKETARTEPYALGDDTPHIGLVAQDFDNLKAKHQAAGMIFDELNGTIYFIKDPDGHILEILPPK